MTATDDDRTAPTGDADALKNALRDNLTPEGIATIIAFLQPATMQRAATEDGARALRELEWFTETLIGLVGRSEYRRLLDELRL